MKYRNKFTVALWIMILASMICLAACSSRSYEYTVVPIPLKPDSPTEIPTQESTMPSTEPEPTEPQWQLGLPKADYIEAPYALLNKGEEVSITGKFAHYYVIASEPYDLLVDVSFVRLEYEEAFESYTAYARHNKPVYALASMKIAPFEHLSVNTNLTVLEGKAGWLYVQWSGGKGYMKAEDVSNYRINTGSGNSGRSSKSSTPDDGTDVDVDSLSAAGAAAYVVKLGTYFGPEMGSDFKMCKGTILADETEAYIAVFGIHDELKVLSCDERFCAIYLAENLTVRVPRSLVKLETDSIEIPFTGYSLSGAVAYREYQLRSEYKKLSFNEAVDVLYVLPSLTYDGESVYVIALDGQTVYMAASSVSETKLKPAGSSKSSDDNTDEWTPPAL